MGTTDKGILRLAERALKEGEGEFFHPDLLSIDEGQGPPFLKGYRCRKCGQIDFPKMNRCPSCWGDAFEMVPLSRQGKLYSFSTVHIPGPGLEAPITFGYIDLPEDLRILAQLDGPVGSFVCDEELEVTIGKIRENKEGQPVYSYKFKKLDEDRS